MRAACSIDNCGRPAVGWGWCRRHWGRWKRTGDPLGIYPERTSGSLEQRFAQVGYVEAENGCWLWPRATNKRGYGIFWAGRDRGKDTAHRISWEITNGRRVPTGMEVRHSCDNPPCINPAHLQLGTHQDNMDDRSRRLRQARGESTPRARVTMADVEIMRGLHMQGVTVAEISRRFSMSPSGVRSIVKRKTWKHVAV